MKSRWPRYLILGCCLMGGVLSAVSLHNHSTSSTTYCDLNAMFNCDLVNRSTFSEFHGVPVALVGLIGYIFLFLLSATVGRWVVTALRFAAAVIGLGFALYLAYVEAYVLAVWCLLCIGSLAMISAIVALSGIAVWRTREMESHPDAGK